MTLKVSVLVFSVAMTLAGIVYAVCLMSRGFVLFKNSGPVLGQRMNSLVRCVYIMGFVTGVSMLTHVVFFIAYEMTMSFFTVLCLLIGLGLVTVHAYMTYRRWGTKEDNSYYIASDNMGVIVCSVFQIMFVAIAALYIRENRNSGKRNVIVIPLAVSTSLIIAIVFLRMYVLLSTDDFCTAYGTEKQPTKLCFFSKQDGILPLS